MRDFKDKIVAKTFQPNALLITNPWCWSFAFKRKQFIYTFNLYLKIVYSSLAVFNVKILARFNHCMI